MQNNFTKNLLSVWTRCKQIILLCNAADMLDWKRLGVKWRICNKSTTHHYLGMKDKKDVDVDERMDIFWMFKMASTRFQNIEIVKPI